MTNKPENNRSTGRAYKIPSAGVYLPLKSAPPFGNLITHVHSQYIDDGKSAFSIRLIGHGINRLTPDLLL